MSAPAPLLKPPLESFRHTQALAYEAVTEVARGLEEGVTEKEAARRIQAFLEARGVRHFFHQPFAWFGDRARFANFRTPFAFFPTKRKLEKGMCGILDVAPIVDGFAADVGYAFSLGESSEVNEAIQDLAVFRSYLIEAVLAERPLKEIYEQVDAMIRDLGYENCHQGYPFGVLAHRVDETRVPAMSRPVLFGFGIGSSMAILGKVAEAYVTRSAAKWPFWNGDVHKEARAQPGLWAVEPHMGKGDIGVKWEELMVVTDSNAYWLDNDVPHVKAWKNAGKQVATTAARAVAHG